MDIAITKPMNPAAGQPTSAPGLEFQNGFLRIGHCEKVIPHQVLIGQTMHAAVGNAVRAFSDEPLTDVTHVGAASSNSQNFVCSTWSNKTFLMRHCIGQRSEDYLNAVAGMLERAHELGAPIARPIRSLDGGWLSSRPDGCWIAFEYLPSKFYYSGEGKQIEQAGEAIGRMHAVMSKPELLEIVKSFESRTAVVFDPLSATELLKMLEIARREEPNSQLTKLFESEMEQILAAIEIQGKALGIGWGREQLGTIHYDLHPHNFLVRDTGISIVDYDNFRSGPLAQDIGFALHRLVRQACYHHGAARAGDYVDSFMKGYAQGNPGSKIEEAHIVAHGIDRTLMSLGSVLEAYYGNRDLSYAPYAPKFLMAQREMLFILNSSARFRDLMAR